MDMNLDLNSITQHLDAMFSILGKRVRQTGRVFSQVTLYQRGSALEAGSICISAAGEFPTETALPDDCALVCIGPPPVDVLDNAPNYIILASDTAVAAVLNELQKLFSRFRSWCCSMYAAFHSGQGIQAILDNVLPMFENPIYVHDKNYRIFAYAENRSLDALPWSYDFYNRGRLSTETIQSLTNSPRFAATFLTTVPTYYEREEGIEDFNYLYTNLWIDGKYAGRLFVDERIRPIRALDYALLDELAHIIELVMTHQKYQGDPQSNYTRLHLTRLLDGESLGDDGMAQLLLDLGWNSDTPFFCVQMRLDEDDPYCNISSGICDLLHTKLPACAALLYRKNIFAVIGGVKECQQEAFIQDQIQPIAQDFALRAGISRVGRDLASLRFYYIQTEIALKYSTGKCPVKDFEKHVLAYLLECCTRELPSDMLCPVPLLRLIEYDKVNHTDFAKTLRIYLEADSSPAKAAKLLFVHRSTFLYRLERIQELLGADMQDPGVKLHFLLAFRLLERKEKG